MLGSCRAREVSLGRATRCKLDHDDRTKDLVPQAKAKEQDSSAWLTVHGGWVLLASGVALVALAAVAGSVVAGSVVAPVFAVGGIALIVLGVLHPRVAGQLEFNATGFKLFLSEIERKTRDLSKEEKAGVLDALVEDPEPTLRPLSAEKRAREVVASAENAYHLERMIGEWLVRQGWSLREVPRQKHDDRGVDFVAAQDGQVLAIEAKSTLPLARVDRLLNQLGKVRDMIAADQGSGASAPRIALFLTNLPKEQILDRIAQEGIEVWMPDGEGFKQVR
jgi:hypothetical protein